MTNIDLLLGADISKFQKPKLELEIKRLTKIFGQPFTINLEALTPDEYEEIQNNCVNISKKGELEDIDTSEMQIHTILKGLKSPDMKNKDLMAHFKVPTPKELVKKLFLPGEISEIANKISQLSGFGQDAIEEIKK